VKGPGPFSQLRIGRQAILGGAIPFSASIFARPVSFCIRAFELDNGQQLLCQNPGGVQGQMRSWDAVDVNLCGNDKTKESRAAAGMQVRCHEPSAAQGR